MKDETPARGPFQSSPRPDRLAIMRHQHRDADVLQSAHRTAAGIDRDGGPAIVRLGHDQQEHDDDEDAGDQRFEPGVQIEGIGHQDEHGKREDDRQSSARQAALRGTGDRFQALSR